MYGTLTKPEDLAVLRDLMASRKADTRHRPHLQVERDRGGDAVFRRRPRARKSRHYRGRDNLVRPMKLKRILKWRYARNFVRTDFGICRGVYRLLAID